MRCEAASDDLLDPCSLRHTEDDPHITGRAHVVEDDGEWKRGQFCYSSLLLTQVNVSQIIRVVCLLLARQVCNLRCHHSGPSGVFGHPKGFLILGVHKGVVRTARGASKEPVCRKFHWIKPKSPQLAVQSLLAAFGVYSTLLVLGRKEHAVCPRHGWAVLHCIVVRQCAGGCWRKSTQETSGCPIEDATVPGHCRGRGALRDIQ
mmetsp:Transcript_52474/g.86216  ORF Transcript_52474/g.86216 Transcript_52474/m.86216 type:complete len:204 (-) Transcript_52474:279-890(-)